MAGPHAASGKELVTKIILLELSIGLPVHIEIEGVDFKFFFFVKADNFCVGVYSMDAAVDIYAIMSILRQLGYDVRHDQGQAR